MDMDERIGRLAGIFQRVPEGIVGNHGDATSILTVRI